ncbi:MAG TPA: tetratricopeptide repeat protein [Kiritimatiellia bacterium]|nr:tetratricopeptide repeat protein [Kiritimatiellia bacterium]
MKLIHRCAVALVVLVLTGCSDPSGERELRAGLRELKRDNFVRAKSLFERSIARRPGHIDNAVTHNALGIAAWRLGSLAEATMAFEDSRRLNPNLVEPLYNLGVLAAERDDLRSATRYLNEAAALAPNDPRPLEFLAELYMQRGQWTLARNALYSALDREPRSARIYTAIAAAHAGLRQPEQATEALMFALETNARYTPALFNLAVVYDTLVGDAEQARAFYKRYLAAASREGRAIEARDALARLDRVGVLKPLLPVSATLAPPPPPLPETEPPSETARLVEVAQVDAPVETPPVAEPTPPSPPSVVDGLLQQAEERARSGNIQAAIDLFVRAADAAAAEGRLDRQEHAYREGVRVALDQPRAHALLGQFLYERGRYEQALQAFRQAATINADFAPAQLGLARLAVRNNELDAAVVHYRRAMASDPTASEAVWEYAQLYDKSLELPENAARAYREFAANFPGDGRRTTALARAEELAPTPQPVEPAPAAATVAARLDYRPPTQRNPSAAMQAFNRAGVYREQQDWERAIFFYLRALENDDQVPSTFYNLGICYTMAGDRERARLAYQEAIRLQPGMHDARYNLALLYREAGDVGAAVRLLDEIVRNQPNYAAAHYALGALLAESSQTRARARQHYEQYLRLVPNDRNAPAIRQWLQQN